MELIKISNITPDLYLKPKVAVVGSSGNIKISGQYIDTFDEVIRFNRSPTDKYEDKVGSKTTLRVVNTHVLRSLPQDWKGSPKDFVKYIKDTKVLLHSWDLRTIDTTHQLHSSCKFYSLASQPKKLGGKHLSTGIGTIDLLVTAGIVPHIYYFDLEDEDTGHYWETRPPRRSPCHDIGKEKLYLKELIKQGKVINEQ